jgi:hypothetical protein
MFTRPHSGCGYATSVENQHPPGNMAVLVNAPRAGLRNLEDTIEAIGGA